MGIYDRDYYQETERSTWARGNASVVQTLIVINVVIALADLFSDGWLSAHMAVPSTLLQQPWNFWKLLTAGFAHESLSERNGIWHVAGNMITLWFFGRAVEAVYGSREFLWIYLTLIVIASLGWVLVESLVSAGPMYMLGASGAVAGIVVLFILHFPQVKVMMLFLPIPIPAWVFGIFMITMDVLGASGYRGDRVAFLAHLSGAAFAYVYYRSGIRLTDLVGRWRFPSFQRRPKLRVHSDGRREFDLERSADRILAKMHADGADSLTAEERRILNEYSRHVRQRKN